ncbi:MAG: 9-O-acetylesterase [Verrucomicrobia bacterium]|jgi:sialate O-acetylesterase|nr:9-O-acetylesterase [Verrucomicrobiota bacterium]
MTTSRITIKKQQVESMKKKSIAIILGMAAAVPFAGWSDVQPAALFTDGMVIQRETNAPVWGTADAGEEVTVSASWGETAATTADAAGKWMVKLDTPKASGPYTMTIQGNNTVEINDVLSGEVWFCSGQSNMKYQLRKLANARPKVTEKKYEPVSAYIKQEMDTARDEMLRQFTVAENTSPFEPLETLSGQWVASSPETNPDFSGTPYFFGRELRREVNVPVGLIKCVWGGTRVESWMPAEAFLQDKEMAAYYEGQMSGLKKRLASWDPKKAEADYQAALKRHKAKGKGRKPKRETNPKGNHKNPTTLFNGMVNPVIPYAIRGAIWYQGESHGASAAHRYEQHFRAMISAWRKQWNQGDPATGAGQAFPFYFAQLANYNKPVTEPVEFNSWALVRDQQRRTLGLKNTGMAVLTDVGEAQDIHPHNKIDVGKRLALWALKHDYKQDVPVCSGPLYKNHEIKDGKVIIKFDHAGSGLMSGETPVLGTARETGEPLKHFQICGADSQWKWARAEITGKDTVTVSHLEVRKPVVVRYAWAQNPESANLYNKEGLPSSIFTTATGE